MDRVYLIAKSATEDNSIPLDSRQLHYRDYNKYLLWKTEFDINNITKDSVLEDIAKFSKEFGIWTILSESDVY